MSCWFHKWERKKAFGSSYSLWKTFGYECKKCGERKVENESKYTEPHHNLLNEAYEWRDKIPKKLENVIKLVKQ